MKDEIKIAKAIEEEVEIEQEQEMSELVDEEIQSSDELQSEEFQPEEANNYDTKAIGITVIVILGIFALTFGGFNLYNGMTSAAVVDIDGLHQENLDGDLNEEEGYIYNGFSFVLVDGLWWTEIAIGDTLTKIPLHFGPKDLEDIQINGELSSQFNKGEIVYVAIDPSVVGGHYVVAMRELSSNVGQGIKRDTQGACTQESLGCEDRKILSCENTEGLPVIELVNTEDSSIELEGTCIKVNGQEYGIIKSVDRLLLQWYGVMD